MKRRAGRRGCARCGALESGAPVIATVAERGTGFILRTKARPDAELWRVTYANRDALPERALAWLKERRMA